MVQKYYLIGIHSTYQIFMFTKDTVNNLSGTIHDSQYVKIIQMLINRKVNFNFIFTLQDTIQQCAWIHLNNGKNSQWKSWEEDLSTGGKVSHMSGWGAAVQNYESCSISCLSSDYKVCPLLSNSLKYGFMVVYHEHYMSCIFLNVCLKEKNSKSNTRYLNIAILQIPALSWHFFSLAYCRFLVPDTCTSVLWSDLTLWRVYIFTYP